MSHKKSLVILFSIIALSFFLLTSPIQLGSSERAQTDTDHPPINSSGNIAMLDPSKHTLQVMVSLPDQQYEVLERLNQEFMDRHPNIEVVLLNTAEDRLYDRWRDEAILGQNADILLLDNDWLNTYSAHGLLAPITETAEALNGIISAISKQTIWNGYVWGAPLDVDPYVLVWNRSVLASLREGSGMLTYEEWDSIYQQWVSDSETLDKGEHYGLYIDTADPHALSALAWASGYLQEDQSSESIIASETEAALKAILDWLGNDRLAEEEAVENIGADRWGMIMEGKLLFMITRLSEADEHADPAIGIGPLPVTRTNGGGGTAWLKGRSFAVHAKGTSKEQAIAWVREMTTEHSQQHLSTASGTLPATLAAIRPGTRRGSNEMTALREALSTAKTLPVAPELSDWLAQYRAAYEAHHHQNNINSMTRIFYQTGTQTISP